MVRSPIHDNTGTVAVDVRFVPWLIAGLDRVIDDLPAGAELPQAVSVGLADLRRLAGADQDAVTSWADCSDVAEAMGVTDRQARRLAASWEPFGAQRTADGWRVPRAVLDEQRQLRSFQ